MIARARRALGLGLIASFVTVTVAGAATTSTTTTAATGSGGRKAIACEVRTEHWKGWGEGEASPEWLAVERAAETFERFDTTPGAAPTFSGKVIGVPPGKGAQVVVVANEGTQWINARNYKSAKVAADGGFTIAADHKPDSEKSLAVNVDGRIAQFLRAEFAAGESARNVELRVGPSRPVVLTMSDPGGKDVRAFRVEVFTPYLVTDDAGRSLRVQRLFAGNSAAGAITFHAPPEPIAVLLSSNGLAPYYEVIDPREAEEFHFKMLPASRVKGVVTRDGQPVANLQIFLVNRAAPLSVTLRKTDGQGRFDVGGRVPGQQEIRIGEFRTSVQLEPGETADLNLEMGAATSPEPAAAR